MPQILGVIQVKGGAGRSTLATNLAGELSKRGRTVLIDGDMPQGTSASWAAIRQQAPQGAEGNLITETAQDHREMLAKVEQHADAQYIVIDGPPRIAEMTRATAIMADLCLVPVGASVAEIWATTDVRSILEEAQRVKPIKAFAVWTRLRSHTRLAKDLSAQAREELGLPFLKAALALRVAYPEALGSGLTVAELPDPAAREELRTLVAEIRRAL